VQRRWRDVMISMTSLYYHQQIVTSPTATRAARALRLQLVALGKEELWLITGNKFTKCNKMTALYKFTWRRYALSRALSSTNSGFQVLPMLC